LNIYKHWLGQPKFTRRLIVHVAESARQQNASNRLGRAFKTHQAFRHTTLSMGKTQFKHLTDSNDIGTITVSRHFKYRCTLFWLEMTAFYAISPKYFKLLKLFKTDSTQLGVCFHHPKASTIKRRNNQNSPNGSIRGITMMNTP
jgi:hypothetical protein